MRLHDTSIDGVVVVELEVHSDERGFFARTYSSSTFAAHGLLAVPHETNVSLNQKAATLRGLHYQAEPHPDPKLVRCTSGAMFDVAVDLRSDSSTYLQWFGTTLSAANRLALHIPAGCAHGYLTLQDATEVSYLMGAAYHADLSRGVRWNDPAFAIEWPIQPEVMSQRDSIFPDFVL